MSRLPGAIGLASCLGVMACAGLDATSQVPVLVPCADLAGDEIPARQIGLPTRGALVTSAQIVPATPATPSNRPGSLALSQPEHCRIEGSIRPIDEDAPTIDFVVVVPTDWNGGSWHMGGGGLNGFIPGLTDQGAGTFAPDEPSLLGQGYAVYGGDSGHQGRSTDWARNREAFLNFAYEALKKTNDAAQAVIEALEGRRAEVRYFSGSSQGGREGLEAVAQYPEDYDGVLSGVPLAYFQGLLIDPTVKALVQARPGGWIQPSKHDMIDAAIMSLCDSLDGLEDAAISNPLACSELLDVDVAATPLRSLRCPSGEDDGDHCLSDRQLETVNALHTSVELPYTLPNGKDDWPGWGSGADTRLLSPTEPDVETGAGPFGIGANVQRQVFGGSTDYNLYEFDFVEQRARIESLSRDLDVPPDWSDFIDRGGRLIWIDAAADVISNPRAQMRLYDDVVRANGQDAVDASVRFYILPMGDHGGGAATMTGEALPSRWNASGALRDWVERGMTPPDAPVISAYDGGTVDAARLMCRYPSYPHYEGGDPDSASSYGCRGSS